MSGIMMVVDTAVTVPVNAAALIDDTDFKTREESVVFNQAGLDLVWNFVTPAGVMTQTAVTPTDTAGVYDWTNVGNGMYKIEIPASGGVSINNDTEGYGWFTGFATGILPWASPIITFAPAHVVNGLVTGSDNLQVDTVQVGGTAQTAGDLAAMLTIIDDFLDTEIAAILAAVDTEVASILADTDDIQTRLPAALTADGNIKSDALRFGGTLYATALSAEIDAVWDEDIVAAHSTSQTAGLLLRALGALIAARTNNATLHALLGVPDIPGAALSEVIHSGTAQAGSTSGTLKLAATASTTNGFYQHSLVRILSGTGAGQQPRFANGYTGGATKELTILPVWDTTPDATSVYQIYGSGESHVRQVEAGAIVTGSFTAGAVNATVAPNLDAAVSSRASQTSVDTIDDLLDTEIAAILAAVDTEVAAILVDTGTDIPATLAGLFTTALTESYRGTGATGSVAQLLYEILAGILEQSTSGTTKTSKKLDGSTTAKTYTLNDSANPTAITETT